MYKVVELTSQVDIIARRRLQREAWCPALTMDQFLNREEKLSTQSWARERMRTWVLIPDDGTVDDKELHQHALASLETYRLDAIGPNGLHGTAYGIASVFTAAEHRGRGYASALCKGIQSKVKSIDPNALAAILYSDVGPSLYAKSGFFAPDETPPAHYWALREGNSSQKLAEKALEGVEWLTRETAQPVIDQLCEEVKSAAASGDSFTILPTRGQADWLLEREHAVAATLGRSPLAFSGARLNGSLVVEQWVVDWYLSWSDLVGGPLPPCGARRGSSVAIWTAEMSKEENFAKILLLRCGESETDTAAVMAAAVSMAVSSGLCDGGVVLWGPNSVLGKWPISDASMAAAGVTFEDKPRRGNLPMLASLHPDVTHQQWKYIPQAIWC